MYIYVISFLSCNVFLADMDMDGMNGELDNSRDLAAFNSI